MRTSDHPKHSRWLVRTISTISFSMKQSWTSFGKKFADFRYVLMKFLFILWNFHQCLIRMYYFIGYVLVDLLYLIFGGVFYQILGKYEWNHALLVESSHYWISQRTWRHFFEDRCLLEIFYQLSTTDDEFWNYILLILAEISTSRKIYHCTATNCCIFVALIENFMEF